VRVLRFSVGFGRALWSRTGKDGTQYQIAAIPLGGYVQMLDERENDVTPAERPFAFNNKPLWQRFLVVLAGPVANLLLCLILLWLMLMIGLPDLKPTLGPTRGLAAEVGLHEGDTLLSVAGRTTPTWSQAAPPLVLAAMDRRPVSVGVRTQAGETVERILPLQRLPAEFNQDETLTVIGMEPYGARDLPPVVGSVAADSGASGVLQSGDRVVTVGGQPIAHFSEIGPAIQTARARSGSAVAVRIERHGVTMDVNVVPSLSHDNGPSRWVLGIGGLSPEKAIRRYGPIDAIGESFAQTAQMGRNILGILFRLVNGSASLKNISGVVGIAQAANESAGLGVAWYLNLLATLSLSLCIMNLLPIPVLDGGHLLYYLIELVSGRPVSERLLMAGQYAGLALLAGLMGLAFYNDIFRLVS
jgi:regulator of sigma E protease